MTNRQLVLASVLALGLSACGGGNDSSTPPPGPTVDQVHEPGTVGFNVFVNSALAQTFTVGMTGTLDSVDLLLQTQSSASDHMIRIDIRGTTGGSPNLDDGAVLGSRLVTATSLPVSPSQAFVTIDFRGEGIPVIAGQTLAIVLMYVSGNSVAGVVWLGEPASVEEYVGGAPFFRLGGSGTAWNVSNPDSDQYFRTRVLTP